MLKRHTSASTFLEFSGDEIGRSFVLPRRPTERRNECVACLLQNYYSTNRDIILWSRPFEKKWENAPILQVRRQLLHHTAANALSSTTQRFRTPAGPPNSYHVRPSSHASLRNRNHVYRRRCNSMRHQKYAMSHRMLASNKNAENPMHRKEFQPHISGIDAEHFVTEYPILRRKTERYHRSSDIADGMMVGQYNHPAYTRKVPSSPPPSQRTLNINKQATSQHPIQVGNEAIRELLACRNKFCSIERLHQGNQKQGKSTKFFASISRLWSRKKHAGDGGIQTNDKTNFAALSSISGKDRTSCRRNIIDISFENPPAGSLQPQSIIPTHPPFSNNHDRVTFPAALVECEVQPDGKFHTNSLRLRQRHRKPYLQETAPKRHSMYSDDQLQGVSIVDNISGLKKLIHEPQNLQDFLSVKYLALFFRKFLLTEFSEENLDFWLECEAYKATSSSRRTKHALNIYEKYVKANSIREINVTVHIRKGIEKKLNNPDLRMFEEAQSHVYALMSSDSFKRFLKSDIYEDLKEACPLSTSVRKRRSNSIRESIHKKLRR